MTKILRLPFIPVLIAYAVGLFGGQFSLFNLSWELFLLLFLLALWIFLILLKKVQWASWVALVFFLLLGAVSIQSYLYPNHSSSHVSHFIGP